MIRGASGRQAQAAFEMLWSSSPAGRPRRREDNEFMARCLRSNAQRDQQVAAYLSERAASLVATPTVSCSRITYSADNPRFQNARNEDRDNPREEYMNDQRLQYKTVTATFLNFMSGAQSTLNMENQYYIPVHRLSRTFQNLRDRQVSTLVITNRSADGANGTGEVISHFIERNARRNTRGSMAVISVSSRGGISLRNPLSSQQATPWYLHSKSMVRDHRDVWMGSFNIDPRSYHTNLEYGVEVSNCPELARAIETDYQRMVNIYQEDLVNCASCRAEIPTLDPIE